MRFYYFGVNFFDQPALPVDYQEIITWRYCNNFIKYLQITSKNFHQWFWWCFY